MTPYSSIGIVYKHPVCDSALLKPRRLTKSSWNLQGGSHGLSDTSSDKAWSLPLGAAILGIRQLGLNGWDQQECLALENELGAWQQEGNLSDPTAALRCDSLKAAMPEGNEASLGACRCIPCGGAGDLQCCHHSS